MGIWKNIAVVGSIYIELGYYDYDLWSKKMIEEFKDFEINPHLKEIFKVSQGIVDRYKHINHSKFS